MKETKVEMDVVDPNDPMLSPTQGDGGAPTIENRPLTKDDAVARYNQMADSLSYKIVHTIWSLIPVVGLVIGIMRYSDDYCPAETSIAPILIAQGVIGLINLVSNVFGKILGDQSKGGPGPCTFLVSIISLVSFILYIVACVIVFGLYSSVEYEKTGTNDDVYCDSLLYRFAFWSLASSFIVLGVTILFLILACCCACTAVMCFGNSKN